MKKTSSSKKESSLKINPEFEKYFKNQLTKLFKSSPLKNSTQNLLKQSMLYTLLAPSSHFRAVLSIETTKCLKQEAKKIFPWAMAIEMFHSGSLILDDLPAMDNGKKRRTKKCNHLVFGEDLSLLAGSCLFIEAFSLLNQEVFKKKQSQILELFISKVGFQGVMGGQALDLRLKKPTNSEILKMIQLKTGSLIEASVAAPLLLWAKNQKTKTALTNFAKSLGMAYQISDDLQDKDFLFKKEEAKKQLRDLTKKSLKSLEPLKEKADSLKKLCLLNEERSSKNLTTK